MFLRVLTLALFAGCCNVALGTNGPVLSVNPFQNDNFFFESMAVRRGGEYGGKGGGGGLSLAAVNAPLVTMMSPNFIPTPPILEQNFPVQSSSFMMAPVATFGAAPVKGGAFAPMNKGGGGRQFSIPLTSGPAFAPTQAVNLAQATGPVLASVQATAPALAPVQNVAPIGVQAVNVAQAPTLAQAQAVNVGAFQMTGAAFAPVQTSGQTLAQVPAVAPVGGQVVNLGQTAGQVLSPVVQNAAGFGEQAVNVGAFQMAGTAFAPIQTAGQALAPVQPVTPIGVSGVNVAQAPTLAVAPVGAVQMTGAAFAPVQTAGSVKGGQRAVLVSSPGIMRAPMKGGNVRMVNFATAPIGMAVPLRSNVIASAPTVNVAQSPQMFVIPQSEQVARQLLPIGNAPSFTPAVANAAFFPNTINGKGNAQSVNVRQLSPKQNIRIVPRVNARPILPTRNIRFLPTVNVGPPPSVRIIPRVNVRPSQQKVRIIERVNVRTPPQKVRIIQRVLTTNRVEKPIMAPPTFIQRKPVDGGTFVINAPPIRIEAKAPKVAPTKTVETNPIDGGTMVVEAPPVQVGPDHVVGQTETIDGGTITQNVAAIAPQPEINVLGPEIAATNVIAQQPIERTQRLIPLVQNPGLSFQNNIQPFMTQRQFVGAAQGVAPTQIGVVNSPVMFPRGVQGLSRFSNIEGRFESGLVSTDDRDSSRFLGPVVGPGGIQQFPAAISGTSDGLLDNRIDDSRLLANGGGLVAQNGLQFDDGRGDFIGTAAGGAINGNENFLPEASFFEDKTGGVVKTSIKKEGPPAEKMTKETKVKEQEVVTGKSEPKSLVSASETKSVSDSNSIDIVDVQSSVIATNDVKLPTEDVVKVDGSLDMTVVSVNTDQKGNNSKVKKDSTSVNSGSDAKVLFTTPASATP